MTGKMTAATAATAAEGIAMLASCSYRLSLAEGCGSPAGAPLQMRRLLLLLKLPLLTFDVLLLLLVCLSSSSS